jgi:DNA-binding CsgD family transcriptional regulator
LAGSRRDLPVAGLCIALLGAVFVAEVLTPDVVVGAFALLPLLAAMWVLPARLAYLVAAAAILFFGAAVALEATNRTTEILIGVATLVIALAARFYASGLASLLSRGRHIRPGITNWVGPGPVAGLDRSLHGPRSLTRRELEVARLAAVGYTAAEIGRRLNIGGRTVESHLASAYSKLRITSRLQLIRIASKLGAPPIA